MGSSKLLGTAPDQVPTNADLGGMAFQDPAAVKITGGDVIANQYVDTAISEVKPSLLLDFANGKTLDPRITFTRSTTATYYDGKTTAMAEQNLATYSQDFAVWNKQNAIVFPNSAIAPDGTNTACTLVPNSGSVDYPCVYKSIGQTNVTISVYAKAAGKSWINFIGSSGGAGAVWFNLSAGTIGTNAATGAYTASMVSVGNGWYRCSVFYNNVNAPLIQINVSDSDNTYTVSGNGVSGVYIWGAQAEQRSGASAYTPTTSSPVTNYIPALQTAGGGAPRFDHDPITGESKGLLIEEQRTNLISYSTDFASWSGQGSVSVTPSYTIGPDGNKLASKLASTDTSGLYQDRLAFDQLVTLSAGTYTLSVYAKPDGANYLGLTLYDGTAYRANVLFNVQTGTVAELNAGTPGVAYVGNGWYRIWVTGTITQDLADANRASGFWPHVRAENNTGVAQNSNQNNGICIWGAQLEAGAFPTSYIPTTSAQVTRAIDWANISGANFSSTIRADEGTIFWEASTNYAQGGIEVFDLDTGSNANRLRTRFMSTQVDYVISGNSAGGISLGAMYANTSTKLALAFRNGDQAASMNGGSVGTTNVTGVLPFTYARIGGNWAQSESLNGTIKRLAYYPKRLSNAELQEMTQ